MKNLYKKKTRSQQIYRSCLPAAAGKAERFCRSGFLRQPEGPVQSSYIGLDCLSMKLTRHLNKWKEWMLRESKTDQKKTQPPHRRPTAQSMRGRQLHRKSRVTKSTTWPSTQPPTPRRHQTDMGCTARHLRLVIHIGQKLFSFLAHHVSCKNSYLESSENYWD